MLNASNNAITVLTSSIDNIATQIEVQDSLLFPVPPFVITIENEIILVTNVVGNIFTVTRGQENTIATGHLAGAEIEHRWTAGMHKKIVDTINDNKSEVDAHLAQNATNDVHGLAGKVIEESGSNDHGFYTKFGDGTAICWLTDLEIANYTGQNINLPYPVNFIGQPSSIGVATTGFPSDRFTLFVTNGGVSVYGTTTDWLLRLNSNSWEGSAIPLNRINLFASGRYK